jgi:hypothetical protein
MVRFGAAAGMGADDIGRGIIGQLRQSSEVRSLIGSRCSTAHYSSRWSELHFRESEAVTQAVCGAREAFEFFAPAGIEQVKLLHIRGKRGKLDADEAQHFNAIPGVLEKFANRAEKYFVKVRRLDECVASGDGFEVGVTKRKAHSSRAQTCIAQALRRLLAQVA